MQFIYSLNFDEIRLFALAQEDAKTPYSAGVQIDYPNQVYFGDTHLHTSYSADAGMAGAILTPEDAYRFAKGELIESNTGLPVRLTRPLDFLVVADHAENLGLAPLIEASDPAILKNDWGKMVHDLVKAGEAPQAFNEWIAKMQALDDPFAGDTAMIEAAWNYITDTADKYNSPGEFTAIIGFEWTSGPNGNNLHRNILFRDDKSFADQIIPLSYYDSGDPEVLWQWIADYEKKTGGKMLAIAHNDNFFGKMALLEPSTDPIRFEEVIAGRVPEDRPEDTKIRAVKTSASGLAAVWARENTREALWDAIYRKEVYGTTGTRLKVRVFGGFNFAADDLYRSDFAAHAYGNGVPMGGDLSAAPAEKAPTFLVQALKDTDGANLDRVQMVKGWLDADGETHEKVYDIALADGRKDGSQKVGNTVNVAEASYSNSIGDISLDAFWKDPDFDPEQKVFYYVRVLEIPTPRWTTYDAKLLGVDLPEDVPASIQERAYTSAIWFNP